MSHSNKIHDKQVGFTLIELLIVIAIIAILAGVVFVALDPLTRFKDSRDSRRWNDVSETVHAIKLDQVDNKGPYLAAITALTADEIYMIGTDVTGCDDQNALCDVVVASDTHCADLGGLITDGYLAEVPIGPNGDGVWDAGTTGYTIIRKANGTVSIQSCESENTGAIYVQR